jgi:hypothetical protein
MRHGKRMKNRFEKTKWPEGKPKSRKSKPSTPVGAQDGGAEDGGATYSRHDRCHGRLKTNQRSNGGRLPIISVLSLFLFPRLRPIKEDKHA